MAVHYEVIPHREQHEEVGFEGEASEKLGKGCLDRFRVLGKQLLELIQDDQAVLGPLAPLRAKLDSDVGLFEVLDQLGDTSCFTQLRCQGLSQLIEGSVAWGGDQSLPTVGERGEKTGSQKGALARPRRSDHRQQVGPTQFLPQGLYLELPAVEVLRILFLKGGEPGVGSGSVIADSSQCYFFEGPRQL